jgi:hypothetical protein
MVSRVQTAHLPDRRNVARIGKIVKLLGELLKERMTAQDDYARAMRRALGRKPFLQSGGRYLRREEAHDRSRLR